MLKLLLVLKTELMFRMFGIPSNRFSTHRTSQHSTVSRLHADDLFTDTIEYSTCHCTVELQKVK